MKLILIFFNLLLIGSNSIESTNVENVISIESVIIPNNLLLRRGVYNETDFDNMPNNIKDTVQFKMEKSFIELGEELLSYKRIDIRTKVALTKDNGEKEKLFIDGNGIMLYQNKFFKGSLKTMRFLRGEE